MAWILKSKPYGVKRSKLIKGDNGSVSWRVTTTRDEVLTLGVAEFVLVKVDWQSLYGDEV